MCKTISGSPFEQPSWDECDEFLAALEVICRRDGTDDPTQAQIDEATELAHPASDYDPREDGRFDTLEEAAND